MDEQLLGSPLIHGELLLPLGTCPGGVEEDVLWCFALL